MQVDQSVLIRAMMWLLKHQGPQGEFSEVGTLIHTEMLVTLDDGPVALTAYVLMALLVDESYVVSQKQRPVRVYQVLDLKGSEKEWIIFILGASVCRKCTQLMFQWPRCTWRTKCPVEGSVTTACVWWLMH